VSRYPLRRLRDVGVRLYDCKHKTPKPVASGYPYIAIPDLRDGRIDLTNARRITERDYEEWTRRTKPRAGDIIVTRRGRVGDTATVPNGLECAIGQNLVLLRSEKAVVSQRYLRWALRGTAYREQVEKYLNVGAVFDSLNVRDIPLFEIPVPPVDAQDAIAALLGALDDRIELNRRMSETLEWTAEAIFRRTTSEAARASADDEFVITMGQSPPGETYNEIGAGMPFFQGRADFGFRYPTERVFCTAPTRLASAGDTLVSVRAPVGDINMALVDCAVGRGVAAVRHRSGSRSFTYYAMRGLRREFDVFESEGTVFGSLSKKDFHRLRVPALPTPEVARFEELAAPLDQRIELNERESRTLAALRDALLPKLISGELRIRDAERAAEPAT